MGAYAQNRLIFTIPFGIFSLYRNVFLSSMIHFRERLTIRKPRTCSKRGGRGIIEVFRNDWEEFDEIKCDNCVLSQMLT